MRRGSCGAYGLSPGTGVGCRSGHLELLSWIYCVRGGRGQATLLPSSPPLFLNTRTLLGLDTEQTLAAQTLSEEDPAGVRGHVLKGGGSRLCSMTWILIDSPEWVSGDRGESREEFRTLTPMVIRLRGGRLQVTTRRTPLLQRWVCVFTFPETRHWTTCFPLIDSWVEKGQECALFARWSVGCWHLEEDRRGHALQ